MTLEQAEAFVQTVASATGRSPLIYVHPTWANGGETHFVLVIRVVS